MNQTKSFSRDTRLRAKYNDFEHTIYSNDWFLPWVKDYLFNDAFLKLSIFIFLSSHPGLSNSGVALVIPHPGEVDIVDAFEIR